MHATGFTFKSGPGRSRVLLWGIIFLALALRVWGLDHQLPYKSYIEEDEFIYTALKYGTGDLNPHWFFHPPLYSYFLFALYVGYYMLGCLAGWFSAPQNLILQYLVDPSAFYVIARCFSAILIVPSILLLYGIAKALYSGRIALVASAIFAVAPLHIKYSHYGCTEPLLVFFGLATAYWAVQAMQTGSLRYSLLAGFFTGLTAGTKYVGAFIVGLLFVAHIGPRGKSGWRRLLAGLAAAAAGFFIVCPFPIISPREYFSNIALLLSQPLSVGEYAWVRFHNLHLAFLTHYMPRGLGPAVAWLSVAAIIFLWLRRRRCDVFVAMVPTLFFIVIGFSRLYYDRYMLICYPFFAIASAVLLNVIVGKVSRQPAVVLAALCALVAVPSLAMSIARVHQMTLPATTMVAAQWITDNLPPGSRILVDFAPVPRTEESIVREQRMKLQSQRCDYAYRSKTDLFFQLQRKAARGRKAFDVTRILHPRGFYMKGEGKGYEEEWMTPEIMKELMEAYDRYDYVLISTQKVTRYGDAEKLPKRFRFMNDFYSGIDERGELVKVFKSEPGVSHGEMFKLYRLRRGEGER